MDQERTRIQADLRGLIEGEVFCDDLYARMYASDASVYEIPPLGVIRPKVVNDVVQTVNYARENGLSIFLRGGGTGLSGQSLGSGLVLDFSRFMRRMISCDLPHIRVQPGLILAEMNRTINAKKHLFGPDPATRSVSTIGSVLSVDGSGSHWPIYGSSGDCIESMQVVLANGEVAEFSKHNIANAIDGIAPVDRLTSGVAEILAKHRDALATPPWGAVARGCGYRLDKIEKDNHINLARLLTGAEGTLGIITEATLRVEPTPPCRGVVLLFFERLEAAARGALEAAKEGVAACDLMDRRLLEIARETESRYEGILPRGAEAMLLVEIVGSDSASVRQRLNQLVSRLQRRGKMLLASRVTTDPLERDFFWRLCRRVIPRLYRLKGSTRPLPFVEDIAVPPARLPEFLVEVQNINRSERVTATVFCHAAHGQLHIRPFLDLSAPDQVAKMERLAEKLYEKVWEFKGTISGEHALGLSRSWFARRQLGNWFAPNKEIKELFDPENLFNPGKLITDTPQRIVENLRRVNAAPTILNLSGTGRSESSSSISADDISVTTLDLTMAEADANAISALQNNNTGNGSVSTDSVSQNGAVAIGATEAASTVSPPKSVNLPLILEWSESEPIGMVARACNGCGRCRTTATNERMCPVFKATNAEEASPRAKANLIRAIASGQMPAAQMETDAFKKIADLCFHCHQCRLECPATVDIPKLMVEAKSQYVATNGLRIADLLLTRLDLLASWASRFPRLANWALQNVRMRWLLDKAVGIAQGRKLPKIANQSFTRWAVKQRLHRPTKSRGRKVLFFADQYVTWHNPMLGQAFVEVMRHHRIEVFVPNVAMQSWIAKIAMGDVQRARKLARPTVRLLAEAVRQGYQIVTMEPSAALCLQHEYLNLFDDEDSRLVAANSFEACRFLWNLHSSNELELDLKPLAMSAVYHQPCHMRAIDPEEPGRLLMQLIPGLIVQEANAGCSGMAGTYGLKRENYRSSLRIGWGLISTMQNTSAQIGLTECTACKLQMEQAVTKPTLHPIALLAYAYGKLPAVENWLSSRNEGLLVT